MFSVFTKIHDQKCPDNPDHGDHFFYSYKVKLSDETSSSSTDYSSSLPTEELF